MSDPVVLALILGSGIIVIGFLSNLLFERTGFPDMLWLILLGVMLGPVLGLFDVPSMMGLAPYLAGLALVFILFDGGMRMNIYRVVAESPRATTLAFMGFALSMAAISLFMVYVAGIPPIYALLFGSMYGGSSSVAVVSLAGKIKMSEKCSTILTLESAVTDILCIVFSLVIIEIILTGQIDYGSVGRLVIGRFSIGAVIGVLFGLFWLGVLRRASNKPYAYMLSLAMVLFAYATCEYLGGSGALSSLLFGMVLGNEKEVRHMLRMKNQNGSVVDEGLRRFESEIAFIIRSFFFVYLGLIVSIGSLREVTIGILLSVLLLLVRVGSVALATVRSDLKCERTLMSSVMTRGLAAAVLATLPWQYAAADPNFAVLAPSYINIAVIIIISTAIICTAGVFVRHLKEKRA